MDFEIIWKKIHGSISHEEEEALNNWLSESEENRRYFENAKHFYLKGSDFDRKTADTTQAWLKVLDKIDAPKTRSLKRLMVPVGIAASVALIVLAGNYFLKSVPEPVPTVADVTQKIEPGTNKAILITDDDQVHELSSGHSLSLSTGGMQVRSEGTSLQYTASESAPEEVKYNTLKIPRGGEFFLTLSDGTKVWLNSETTLRYPVYFIGEKREVELTGEAFFDVTKSNVPFRVISGEQIVEVLGTEFNISSYPEDSVTVTTLVEGKVNVSLGSNRGISQVLTPNLQSSLVRGAGRITLKEVDTNEFTAWKDGRFYFRDQSLSKMMMTLSRWYDVEVDFQKEGAGDILFTGNIRRHEDLENILLLIEKTHEVKFEIEGRSITVK